VDRLVDLLDRDATARGTGAAAWRSRNDGGGRVPTVAPWYSGDVEPVFLVETTLRDGSYAVDFQFTGADTAFIVSTLDQAGVTYIELCHGSGFRNETSPYRSKIRPAAIDEVHLAAAQAANRSSKLGVITGSWAVRDFPLLVAHGFSFVRFGLLPHELLLDESFATVEAAKKLGLTVSVNLMQTTSVPVLDVARAAARFAKVGTDWFYVVDSAGGMMPSTVREYVRAVVQESGLVVGLHAHNNTGLALANCLAAIEAGATRVDSTLQGVGRGTGNPSTEQLLLALQALGHERSVRVDPILRLGDLARPLFEDKGQDPTFFASGIAEIHSSNVPLLVKHAIEHKRSPREFLLQVGRGAQRLVGVGVKTLPDAVTAPAIEHTPPALNPEPDDAVVEVVANYLLESSSRLDRVVEALYGAAAKIHKRSILHLVPAHDALFAGPVGWETEHVVGVTVPTDPRATLELGDRDLTFVVIDPSFGPLTHPRVVRYSHRRLVSEAAVELAEVCGGAVALSVASDAARDLRACLEHAGIASDGSGDVIIADGSTRDGLDRLTRATTVILIGRHDVGADWVVAGRAAGARVVRPPLGPVLARRLASRADLASRLSTGGTSQQIDSVPIVDTFVAAAPNEVVIDDSVLPTHVVSAGSVQPKVAARAAARLRLRALFNGSGSL
jgi:4-hydroxy 2-oxovalerate aldolase